MVFACRDTMYCLCWLACFVGFRVDLDLFCVLSVMGFALRYCGML